MTTRPGGIVKILQIIPAPEWMRVRTFDRETKETWEQRVACLALIDEGEDEGCRVVAVTGRDCSEWDGQFDVDAGDSTYSVSIIESEK